MWATNQCVRTGLAQQSVVPRSTAVVVGLPAAEVGNKRVPGMSYPTRLL